jgi:glutamate synthase (NADPH) small chain
MGSPTGFLEFGRELPELRPVSERIGDYRDVYRPFPEAKLKRQAARCMDCGVPFCQAACPLGNIIPDWNDLVQHGRWREAYERLRATNNFPEFTGRICPAPCESACVLGVIEPPVTIEQIEKQIVEVAFRDGWVQPRPPARRTGRRVAVVGSGPAGLAAADQLNQAGHSVTVFERANRAGGLLRYGIPDFKLEKWVLDRRLQLMEQEGVCFKNGVYVGADVTAEDLLAYDAVVLCGGATKPRDLPLPGRELEGIHFAWDYLMQQNRRVAGDDLEAENLSAIDAAGKHVIVIGGGDTGSDCVGTANRQGALSVTQFELLPMPPRERPPHQPWPFMPMVLTSSSSHEEGVERHWSILTKAFVGEEDRLRSLRTVHIEWTSNGTTRFEEVSGSRRDWPADLIFLAIGYLGPEPDGIVSQIGAELDERGNLRTEASYMTSVRGVFAAGDMRRGQSLVVWAISEGREAARGVDHFLMGETSLPTKGSGDLPILR